MRRLSRMLLAGMSISTMTILSGANAFAHVVVTPNTVTTAAYNLYTVSVPNERTVNTTSVKLVVPNGVTDITPTQLNGWSIVLDTSSKNGESVPTEITWTGTLEQGLRAEFTFSAKAPDAPTELHWKAYQTYADGMSVAWDQASGTETNASGPFSVTKVTAVAGRANSDVSPGVNQSSDIWSRRAFYVAIASLIVSVIGLSVVLLKGDLSRRS